MEAVGAVVEGYYAAESAWALANDMGIEMPICHAVHAVLYEGADPLKMLMELMQREKKEESSWI